MLMVTTRESGNVTSVIRVKVGLIDSIMTATPTKVTEAVMSWVRLCGSVELTLSTSLVTRLRISPWVLESKYFRGRRDSLALTSFRIWYTVL